MKSTRTRARAMASLSRMLVVALLAPLLGIVTTIVASQPADAQGTIHIGVAICRDDTLQECDPRVESHWGGSRKLNDTDVARIRLSIINPTDLTVVEAEIDNTYSGNCNASWFDVPSLRVLEPQTTTYLICDVPPSSRDWEMTAYVTAHHDRYGELSDHDTAYGYVEIDASVGTERDVACLPGTVIDCADLDDVYLSPDNNTVDVQDEAALAGQESAADAPADVASIGVDLTPQQSTASVITTEPGPGVSRVGAPDASGGAGWASSPLTLLFAALVFGGMGTLLGLSLRRQHTEGVPVEVRTHR